MASTTTLSEQLAILPVQFHHQALLACCPSIIRDKSFALQGVTEGRWLSAVSYSSIFRAFATFQSLRHLQINCYFLKGVLENASVLQLLAQSIKRLSQLRSLELSVLDNNTLWDAIASMTTLQSLTLDNADLTQQHVLHISQALQALTSLRRVILKLSPWTDIWQTRATFSGDKLLEAINEMPSLDHLAVSVQGGCFRVDERGISSLALQFRTNLVHLDVRGRHLGSVLSNSLPPSSLKFLDFSDNMMTSKSMLQLVTALSRMTGLETLNVHETGVQFDGQSIAVLCNALSRMSCLQHLKLSGLQVVTTGCNCRKGCSRIFFQAVDSSRVAIDACS